MRGNNMRRPADREGFIAYKYNMPVSLHRDVSEVTEELNEPIKAFLDRAVIAELERARSQKEEIA